MSGMGTWLLIGMLLAAPAFAGPRVLLLWDDDQGTPPEALNPNTLNLIAALESEGMEIVLSDRPQQGYNGFNPSPAGFDVVVHLNGNPDVIKVMPSSGVSALVSYVQNGGGFITGENTSAQLTVPPAFGGLSVAMRDLMPFERTGGRGPQPVTLSAIGGAQGHPVLTGLPSSFTFNAARLSGGVRSYASDPAQPLMEDELGSAAVVIRPFQSGRAVGFHHAGNFGAQDALSDVNVQRLYSNAIRWADQRPPVVTAIERLADPVLTGPEAPFRVLFSEGVQGVDASDFSVTGGFSFSQIVVTPVSSREYNVAVTGLSGQGSLQLDLVDNGTIRDRSFNQNPLGGPGAGTGDFAGPAYTGDLAPPVIVSFLADKLIVPAGQRSTMSFFFSEPMDTTLTPAVTLTTQNNGLINASPFGAVFQEGPRATDGLLALYDFREGGGSAVRDVSGVGAPLDLTIQDPGAVTWLEGALAINSNTVIQSPGPAAKLIEAITASNELTFEAWVRPENATQTGPARLISISESTGLRNATLAQDGSRFEGRLRTTETSDNGIPNLPTGTSFAAAGALQHVVFTRTASGEATVYVDGVAAAAMTLGGDLSNWNPQHPLLLANEFSVNRPWLGELHLAAIYDRALSPAEVAGNFGGGANAPTGGDGAWLAPELYQVTMDRTVVPADEGSANIRVSGARDLAGNVMAPDTSRNIGLIRSSLAIVQQPPVFLRAEAGSTVTLSVEVVGGVGAVTFEWFRELPNKSLEPLGGNAPELVLDAIDFDDTGVYLCVVSDIDQVVQSQGVFLEVVEQLPVAGMAGCLTLTILLIAAAAWSLRRPRAGAGPLQLR